MINAVGLLNLYSATSSFDSSLRYHYFEGQLIGAIVGLVLALLITLFHYRHYESWSYLIFGGSLLLLILVLSLGTQVYGHQSWISLAGLRIQPSEIAKLALIFMLAKHFSKSDSFHKMGFVEMIPSMVIFLIPTLLVMKQGDLGSSLFYGLIYVTLALVKGIKGRVLLILGGFVVIVCIIAYLFVLSPYQKDRIHSFMNPENDKQGSGYHLIQSKIAVGSGGLTGKGYLEGQTHKLKFIPERHTDFVFPVLAEEWGFLGSGVILLLYGVFFYICMIISGRTHDRFSFYLVVGIMALFFWHVVVNLGGVLGLMPLTGVPLPFFSYGRSSLLTMWISVGLLLNISMRRYTFT